MVGRSLACDECTKNCATFHQKQKDLSPIITRFFKVMFGKDCSKVLYLPPEFACSVKHLAGQETQIENSSGQRWPVTVSYVGRTLAFQRGWHKFFKDHDLEEGQFLVFNYIKGSHFLVQIYGRSACERINFNDERPQQNKRSRRNPETVSQDEPVKTTDVNLRNKSSSADTVASGSEFQNCQTHLEVTSADFGRVQLCPISVNMEDPVCMINRDYIYKGEDRNFLSDLSVFERENKTQDSDKFEKALDTEIDLPQPEVTGYASKFEKAIDPKTGSSHTQITEQTKRKEDGTQMPVIRTNIVSEHSGDILTDKSEKTLDTKVALDDTDTTEHRKAKGQNSRMAVIRTNEGHSCESFIDKFEKASDTKLAPHAENTGQTKTKGDDTQINALHKHQIYGHSGDMFTENLHSKPLDYCTSGKDMLDDVPNFQHGKNVIKKEQVELEKEAKDFPVASCGKEPIAAFKPFKAEVKNLSYLELPVRISSIPGRRERGRGKVVYLKDSTGQLWPLLYPETPHCKALTANWRKFCEQNNIKVGDECNFQTENDTPYIYRVDVTRT